MSDITLGIIGGGQLGSMMAIAAKKLNIKTVGITGTNDNGFKGICDVIIKTPASRPDRIQEMHIAVGQIICEMIEKELC